MMRALFFALASGVRVPKKVEINTINITRGCYARMCVEVDLSQLVVGVVGLNGH